ncbi:MAG: hypothetical protein JW828_09245, partial [Sedimentisphaerales bacterium]|nr:hypothetical protein [Sedimentisphaerales bacterium]
LFRLARLVRGKTIRGVQAPKPPNSDAGKEMYVYDFVGMMGIPLVPTADIDTNAQAAFYPVHVLKDQEFRKKFLQMLSDNKPVLMTDGLVGSIPMDRRFRPNLKILKVDGSPKSLLNLGREELNAIRNPLLKPFGLQLDAPNKVGLYLFGEDLIVLENFNDEPVAVTLRFDKPVTPKPVLSIPGESQPGFAGTGSEWSIESFPPRTLAAFQLTQ